MKKLLPILLCLSLLLATAVAMVPAAALSDSVNDGTWSEIDLKALVYQEDTSFYSALNKTYENYDWGFKEIVELDGEEREISSINMRGFSVTQDGKFALMGHLNGSNFRGCALLDLASGTITDVYYNYESEQDSSVPQGPFSFIKGIATDDRGNAYFGCSFSSNYNLATLGIAHINEETKQFEELYQGDIYRFGQPGDSTGIQVGVNGVEVAKIGDRYYCYVMLNYAYDALYCYDVTDPAKPVLNKDFGTNGCIDFMDDQCPVKTNDSQLDDGYYMAVDTDGVILLTAKLKNGKKALMKITPDGSACVASYELENPYSVCHAGKYILIGNKNGQTIKVYNDDDMSEVATVKYESPYGTCITRIQVVNDILFVADSQENDSTLANAVLVAGLTPEAQATVDRMAENLGKSAEGEGSGTEGTDTDANVDATATETDAVTPSESVSASETVTVADESQATGTGAASSTEKAEGSGCSSVISASVTGVAALILAGIGVMLKKKN